MLSELRTGPIISGAGSVNPGRSDYQGAIVTQDAHGRFNELARVNSLFSGGTTLTPINSALFTVATSGATCTPIMGVYNPTGTGIVASVLQATLACVITALQTTGPGPFFWAGATNQTLTLGATPRSRSTLNQNGGFCKDMSGVALTGLTGVLSIYGVSALGGGPVMNIASLQSAAGFMPWSVPTVENIDGGWRIPQGGLLVLLAATTPVGISAASMISWEETAA